MQANVMIAHVWRLRGFTTSYRGCKKVESGSLAPTVLARCKHFAVVDFGFEAPGTFAIRRHRY
jgi:hypothetical protein